MSKINARFPADVSCAIRVIEYQKMLVIVSRDYEKMYL